MPGEQLYGLPQQWIDRLKVMSEWIRTFTVNGASNFKNTPGGCSFTIPPRGPATGGGGGDDVVLVKPETPHAAAKYIGKILVPTNIPGGPDMPLTVADCGNEGAQCLIYNEAEAGLDTNALTEQNQLIKVFRGRVRGVSPAGPTAGYPIVWIWSLGCADEC